MPKFYIIDSIIKEGEASCISGEDAKHITKSLRMKKGDEVLVCDGAGSNYKSRITDTSKDFVLVEITEKVKIDNEPDLKVRLYMAITKGEKFEYAIQKCVELGVYEIIPVITKNTVVKINNSAAIAKNERWNKISYEAAKQSGRSRIPVVKMPVDFDQAIVSLPYNEISYMAYESEDRFSFKSNLEGINTDVVNIFIGPEGGFTKDEDQLARKNGVKTIHLGPRILKAETAAIFCVSTVMFMKGDLDKKPCKI